MGTSKKHPTPDPAPVEATEPKRRTYPGVKVRAIRDGYYGDKLRRVDDVFVIDGTPGKKGTPAAFSDKWMERVDASTPEKLSTNNDIIRRQHDEIQGGQVSRSDADATGNSDPLGDD